MKLIRTSLLNGIAVSVKILTFLGINKLLAIYVGPAGYAALGQFQNAMTMISSFASGAINTGVTKYTAEYYANEEKQHEVWRTSGAIILITSVISSILIIFFKKSIAIWFLEDENLDGVFVWFASLLTFLALNTFFLAILNGKKEIGRYVVANIVGSLFALIITAILLWAWGLYGALVALSIYQSLTFFITIFICYNTSWFRLSYFFGAFDVTAAKNLFKYTLMAISSALCVPISHVLVRNHLVQSIGWDAAGYWEAMWRVSAAYLMLVTTTLSVYYLPRLSELKEHDEIKAEILGCYKIILPSVMFCGCLIYLFRDLIINLLFNENFYPVRQLFLGQLIGDTLKIGSWILAYLMLGKAMIKYFVMTEIIFSTTFYFLVVLMTNYFGLEGVSWAYTINYFIYWGVMYHLIFRNLKGHIKLCT